LSYKKSFFYRTKWLEKQRFKTVGGPKDRNPISNLTTHLTWSNGNPRPRKPFSPVSFQMGGSKKKKKKKKIVAPPPPPPPPPPVTCPPFWGGGGGWGPPPPPPPEGWPIFPLVKTSKNSPRGQPPRKKNLGKNKNKWPLLRTRRENPRCGDFSAKESPPLLAKIPPPKDLVVGVLCRVYFWEKKNPVSLRVAERKLVPPPGPSHCPPPPLPLAAPPICL